MWLFFFFSLRDKGLRFLRKSFRFAGLVFMKQLFPPMYSAYNIIQGVLVKGAMGGLSVLQDSNNQVSLKQATGQEGCPR